MNFERSLSAISIYLVKYLGFLRKNPVNREVWWATIPGVTKSRTQLSIKGSQLLVQRCIKSTIFLITEILLLTVRACGKNSC